MTALRAARSLLLFGVVTLPGGTLHGQGGPSRWRQEDRLVIADFSHITAIAAGFQGVYVSTPHAIIVWQPALHRWEGPFEPPTPDYLTEVFAALVDPLDNSLWLAEPNGWVHFQPAIQLWDRGATAGRLVTIALDRANPTAGLFLRTTAGWFRVGRGVVIPTPSGPPSQPDAPVTIEEAIRRNPTLQSNSSVILQTAGLGRARFTAAAESQDGQGWYVGTDGAGLFFLPLAAAIPEPVPLGLPSPRASAVFAAPKGVWVATDQVDETLAALTYLDEDLGEIRTLHGSPAFGLRFHQARDLVGLERDLWVASDIGVVRVPVDGSQGEIIDQRAGLPDNRVLGMAARRGRIAVGTAAGVALILESGHVQPVAPGFRRPAYATALLGDSVFVGTDLGVWYGVLDIPDLVLTGGMAESARYRLPVLDLAWLGDTLIAVTRTELLLRDPATGEWVAGPDLSLALGRLRRAVPYRDGLWVAGERGIGYASPAGGVRQVLRVGSDLPGSPLDMAVQGRFLWGGTTSGLVRWRLAAIQP